jgi:hypothetical protein
MFSVLATLWNNMLLFLMTKEYRDKIELMSKFYIEGQEEQKLIREKLEIIKSNLQQKMQEFQQEPELDLFKKEDEEKKGYLQ